MKTHTQIIMITLSLMLSLTISNLKAQVVEPDFIGEAFVLNNDSTTVSLDKEIADFSSGTSWSSNSWNALSLEIRGGYSQTRFLPSYNVPLKIVVRAVDNNSDPLAIVSIIKFKARPSKRSVVLSVDNSGTFMNSRTNSNDIIRFNGKKFGKTSYIIELKNLESGEYGIIVSNPNGRDQKRTVVSCFGID
jgi:hypothetical protein